MDRQHREERRWRTDEIQAGLGILAHAYRDRLVHSVQSGDVTADEVQRCRHATDAITAAVESMERNPNETLMLESLLVRLVIDALTGRRTIRRSVAAPRSAPRPQPG